MSSSSVGILNSALQINKKKMDMAMQNIANADNENYSQKVIDTSALVIANSIQGAQINRIRSSSNVLLQKSIFNVNALSKYYSYISDFSKECTDKLSSPSTTDGLFNKLSIFGDAMDTLAINPINSAMRNDVRDKANELSEYVSDFAMYLQEQRYEVDKNISLELKAVNNLIYSIHNASAQQMLYNENSLDYQQIQDDINADLKKLSAYFDINYSKDHAGILHVYLKNGGQEIVGRQKYRFEYEPARSVNDFINDASLNPMYLVTQSIDGREKSKNLFINGGKTSDMLYNLSAGSINGLLYIRDTAIPQVSATIDEFAVKLAIAFNNIHNKGNGSSPVASLTGSVLCTGDDMMIGNGHIIINPMGSDGKPIVSGAYGQIPALNLSLDKFTTNIIGGSFTTRGLVNTINQYFDAAADSRLQINGFHTVNVGVKNLDSSSLELDFDLLAYDSDPAIQNMEFHVTNIVANGVSIALPTNPAITVDNTAHIRTGINGGPSIVVPQSSMPVTLQIAIETVVNGVTSTSTVEYTIDGTPFVNKLYTPVAATSDGAVLKGSGYSTVKASIVDYNGNEIYDDHTQGFLQIKTTQRNSTVAIDSDNSNLASLQNPRVSGSFSGTFGLNDVFVFKNDHSTVNPLQRDNVTPSKNIAIHMKLNDTIKNSANAFAVGKIQKYGKGLEYLNSPSIFFSAGAGDTTLISEYQKLKTSNISFNSTLDISARSSTLYNYAADIVSINNMKAISNDIADRHYTARQEALTTQFIGEIGVDIDSAGIQVLLFQKNFALAAKFLQISNNLLQNLIDSI